MSKTPSASGEPPEPWIDSKEACAYLQIEYSTLLRWIKRNWIKPGGRTPSGELRFRRSELDRLIITK